MFISGRFLIGLAAAAASLLIPVGLEAASGDVSVSRAAELDISPPLPVWPSDQETITNRRPVFRINGRAAAPIDYCGTFSLIPNYYYRYAVLSKI